jgi:hypothetical protein
VWKFRTRSLRVRDEFRAGDSEYPVTGQPARPFGKGSVATDQYPTGEGGGRTGPQGPSYPIIRLASPAHAGFRSKCRSPDRAFLSAAKMR